MVGPRAFRDVGCGVGEAPEMGGINGTMVQDHFLLSHIPLFSDAVQGFHRYYSLEI
jgi:hypothetical protein